MIVKLGLATGLALLLLSGCSGDSSNEVEDTKPKSITEQMTERHVVAIIKNYPPNECLNNLKPTLEDLGLVNVIVSVEDNDVTCEDYGKNNNNIECDIKDTGVDIDTSCVAGADAPGTPDRDSANILLDEASLAAIELI